MSVFKTFVIFLLTYFNNIFCQYELYLFVDLLI